MAITNTGLNAATASDYAKTTTVENKTALGKDDFMTLLLVELQNQDPTEPMDSEKILTQTSQLATLESSENTNNALESLTTALGNSQQFSTIAAIGKMADLGSDAIAHDEGSESSFEMYFPHDIAEGKIEITDASGNVVQTLDIEPNDMGVYEFTWNGLTSSGESADSGVYKIGATYTGSDEQSYTTRVGAYPIESVRFDGGVAYVKLGSSYIAIDQVVEIY